MNALFGWLAWSEILSSAPTSSPNLKKIWPHSSDDGLRCGRDKRFVVVELGLWCGGFKSPGATSAGGRWSAVGLWFWGLGGADWLKTNLAFLGGVGAGFGVLVGVAAWCSALPLRGFVVALARRPSQLVWRIASTNQPGLGPDGNGLLQLLSRRLAVLGLGAGVGPFCFLVGVCFGACFWGTLKELGQRLAKFNLSLAEEKTRVVCFGRFDQ